MNMKKFLAVCAMSIGMSMTFVGSNIVMANAAEEGKHVHVASFFKLPGQESFQWPDEIKGENIIGALEGKADFLVLTQTVGIRNGDVLNIQNDVLRDTTAKDFEDLGINCQLSVNNETETWHIGGKCDVLLPHLNGEKIVGFINATDIKDEKVWHLVWANDKTKVAVYFYKETGAVLGK